jgi:hypothetical protein
MKGSTVFQLALFYLALIIGHEGITIATQIKQRVYLRKQIKQFTQMHQVMEHSMNQMQDSFLEVHEMQSLEHQAFATREIAEMHKSLKESFTYAHSPIREDVMKLKDIPENHILSRNEIKQHRLRVSSLLETAMAVHKTESKTSVGMQMMSDFGKTFSDPKKMESSMSMTAAGGASVFGFADGMYTGMLSEVKGNFEDPKCRTDEMAAKLKDIGVKLNEMWTNFTHIASYSLTKHGRGKLMNSTGNFLKSVAKFIYAGGLFLWECPGTKMFVTMFLMLGPMLILNMAFLYVGGVVVPIIMKYAGIISGAVGSVGFMGKRLKSAYNGTRMIAENKCQEQCKKHIVEDSFSVAGALTQLVLASGLDQIISIKRDKSAPFFKSFKVDMADSFKGDMTKLGDAMKSCKSGNPFKLPKFDSEIASCMPDTPAKEYQMQKDAAWKKYKAKPGKKKLSFAAWEVKNDHLQGPDMKAWKNYIKIKGSKDATGMDYKKFCELLRATKPSSGMGTMKHLVRPAMLAAAMMNKKNATPAEKAAFEKKFGKGKKGDKWKWALSKLNFSLPKVNFTIDLPDDVKPKEFTRTDEMEKMLDQELYNRVVISEKMRCWKNYLIEKRLEWKEPCPFKEWSKQFVGEEHNCVEKDIPMPPAKPVVEPEPLPTPQNKTEGYDDPKPDGGDDPKPDGGDDPKPDGGDDPKIDGGDDPKPDGGDDPKIDGGDDPKPDGGCDDDDDDCVDPKPEPNDPEQKNRTKKQNLVIYVEQARLLVIQNQNLVIYVEQARLLVIQNQNQ